MRVVSAAELCHDRLGDRFATSLSEYDTSRRIEVLVDAFLAPRLKPRAKVLDVGCGLGFFSAVLVSRGMTVTATDIGPGLLEKTRRRVGCECVPADALALRETFGADSFDAVISSECIEHTPDPRKALRQMAAVVKPGGWLAVSTPNLVWSPVVKLATWLRLRPFDGYEHFSTWRSLRTPLQESGMEIVAEQGLHLFPFQFGMHGFSRWCDRRCQWARGVMINLCLLAQKRDPGSR